MHLGNDSPDEGHRPSDAELEAYQLTREEIVRLVLCLLLEERLWPITQAADPEATPGPEKTPRHSA